MHAACAAGRFSVYPIITIDQGLALLSGQPTGERDAAGIFPAGTFNTTVEARLQRFAKAIKSHEDKRTGADEGAEAP